MKTMMLATAAVGTLLVAGPALAADLPMPYKAPPPPPLPFSWTGCYIGGHLGGAWGEGTFDRTLATPGTLITIGSGHADSSSFLGGGQAGCQWQISTVVIGFEGDASGTDLTRANRDFLLFPTFRAHVNALYDVTGRLGFAWDRVLFYAKGGGAWAAADVSTDLFIDRDTFDGWVIGGGIEWAFWDNWSAKIEYLHYDFSDRTFSFVGIPGGVPVSLTTDVQHQINTFKFGVNWRFYPWGAPAAPVVARY